ncbi:G patch domain-containing protein 4 isoform X1 [Arapaima gigas]
MEKFVEGKSRGLRFAEQQLLRHGWEHGKGLGREENGIAEAIRVKVKCDKGGVGHHQGEQFTFHWWDHVFNKASASLAVESSEDGVKVKKVAKEEEEEEEEDAAGIISNKKPRKAELTKAKLYGHFVKSATLLSGQEQPEKKDSSGSDDEDQKLDFSTTTKLSDEDLMKACGGRTAHKGARHGLTMSAKLARLQQQEQEFLAKYSKKTQPAESICKKTTSSSGASSWQEEENQNDDRAGKKAKKKKKRSKENKEDCMLEGGNIGEVSETMAKVDVPKMKKKKHSKEKRGSSAPKESNPTSCTETDCPPPKKKRSEKEKMLIGDIENYSVVSGMAEDAVKPCTDSLGGTDTVPEVKHKDSVKKNSRGSKCKEKNLGGSVEQCCDAVGTHDVNCDPPLTKTRHNSVEVLKLSQREQELEEKQNEIKRTRQKGNTVAGGEMQHETMTVVKKKKKKKSCRKQL